MILRYKRAVVKFNGGNGALLCNRCRIIIVTGFEHQDVEHYCDDCKAGKPVITMDDRLRHLAADRIAISIEDLTPEEIEAIANSKIADIDD